MERRARRGTTGGERLLLAGTLVLGAAGALLASSAVRARVARAAAAAALPSTDGGRLAPELRTPLLPQERASAAPPPDPRTQAFAAVRVLAAELADANATRSAWPTAVLAVAASLDPGARAELVRVLADPARGADERVAAAELIGALDPSAPVLPPAALTFLRAAAVESDAPALRTAAAARVLARSGDAADRAVLVACVLDAAAGERGLVAGWALAAAPAEEVARAVAAGTDWAGAEVAARTAVVLAQIVRGAPALMEELRDELARCAGARLVAAERDPAVRLRGIALLGALDSPRARDGLRAVLADPAAEPALVRAAVGALAACAEDGATLPALVTLLRGAGPHALAGAEALARMDDVPPPIAGEARALLRSVAASAAVPGERRRAVLALAARAEPADRDWLAALARAESDPSVQAFASVSR